jgi:hypothetical protein
MSELGLPILLRSCFITRSILYSDFLSFRSLRSGRSIFILAVSDLFVNCYILFSLVLIMLIVSLSCDP